jgi:hypothetical protein
MRIDELKELKTKDKDSYYVIIHFIKRHFKITDNEFDERKVIRAIFYSLRKYKSRSKMYIIFSDFLKFLKDNHTYNEKEINFMINNIPKPKYERKAWKTWKKVSDRLKFLKRLKRKVQKDIENGETQKREKLNSIIKDIEEFSRRKKELGDKLK